MPVLLLGAGFGVLNGEYLSVFSRVGLLENYRDFKGEI